jgi:uncharacterized protein (TIRG00374 family)
MLPRRFQRGIAFSVILAAGIYLALILYSGGFADLREALSRFPWWGVPVACGLASVNWLLRFVKWERYRQLLGVRITRRQSMLVYFSGFCLSITPGKMGEAYKSILIKRLDGSPISRTAMIVVAERLTDLLALVILMGAGGVWTILRGQHLSGAAEGPDYGRYVGWVAIGTLLFCCILLGVVFCDPLVEFILRQLSRLKWLARVQHKMEAFHEAGKTLLSPRQLVFPTILSVVSWSFEAIALFLIARWISSGTIESKDSPTAAVTLPLCFFAYGFSMIFGNIVIFLPAGVGATEGALGWFLDHAAGLTKPEANTATLVFRACTLWLSVLIGMAAAAIFERNYGHIDFTPEKTDLSAGLP